MEVEEMGAVVVGTKGELSSYRSPLRVLADWFRKSRDNWKQKCMKLKADVKRFKNRASDLQKSRDHWKAKASDHQQEIEALQAEVEQLKAQLVEGDNSSGIKKRLAPMTARPR
jgi:peptidoglycan hydrolase CwlO-like protein